MLRTFWNNLSKIQKIGLIAMAQILVIIVLVLLVQSFTVEKSHVEIENEPVSEAEEEMPKKVKDFVEENIWSMIRSNVAEATRNNVDDVVIREGTYVTTRNSDGSIAANFIVDIDSLKQSYTVSTGWSKDGKEMFETIIDCPPIDQMKYPETVCYGAYYNTYSLDLYLPHMEYPEGADDENADPLAPNYMITGDENSKTLDILVSICDVDRFKKEAWDYLSTVPIDFSDYTVNYEINDINVGC